MNELPKRKSIRIEDYDYSTPGAYFITVCTANREKIFWDNVGADIIRPEKKATFYGAFFNVYFRGLFSMYCQISS